VAPGRSTTSSEKPLLPACADLRQSQKLRLGLDPEGCKGQLHGKEGCAVPASTWLCDPLQNEMLS